LLPQQRLFLCNLFGLQLFDFRKLEHKDVITAKNDNQCFLSLNELKILLPSIEEGEIGIVDPICKVLVAIACSFLLK
jgi:hypothetical protein